MSNYLSENKGDCMKNKEFWIAYVIGAIVTVIITAVVFRILTSI